MTGLRDQVVALVRERGHERRDQPFRLASGQLSHDYVDGKYAVAGGRQLRLASEAVVAVARDLGVEFTAVGGLTMGADALAHGVAMVSGCDWFCVRKQPKSRGLEQWIEGGRLSTADQVLLVEDVVTTGGSIMLAYEKVRDAGARVVAAVPLVDRGDAAAARFAALGVPYAALVTYHDLGIAPVGQPPAVT